MDSLIFSCGKLKIQFCFLCLVLIALSMGGMIPLTNDANASYNIFPVENILDATLITLVVFNLTNKFTLKEVLLTVILLSYLLITLLVFYYRNNYLYDYLITDYILIYKSIFYLVVLSVPMRNALKVRDVAFIFNMLVIAYFIKYAISIFVYKIPRPGIFAENNFEIMLVVLLYFSVMFHKIRINNYVLFLFYCVVFLSGSRSGVACFMLARFFLTDNKKNLVKSLAYMISFSLLAFIAMALFYSRMSGGDVKSIDRVIFLFVFLNEWKSFSIIDFLIGKSIITPLAYGSCHQLSYYQTLFSGTSGTCFSVILHSFVLRTLYDHGVLGLGFISIIPYLILRRNMFSKKFTIVVIGMVLFNGLSVSAFNSIFVVFSILLIILSSNALLKINNE